MKYHVRTPAGVTLDWCDYLHQALAVAAAEAITSPWVLAVNTKTGIALRVA